MGSTNPLDECTIIWLCPLEVELRAAIAMLDKESDEMAPRVRGQNVIYTTGEIGPHKVAIVGYYQEQGLAVSGSMAAEVIRDLPNLQFGLLVGIAGGIPSPTRDIQLGDVAVAVPEGDRPGVVGYDLGKAGEDNHFELKHWQNATHTPLRSVINLVRARYGQRFRRHLTVVERLPQFKRPDTDPPLSGSHPKVHYGTILSGNTVVKSKAKRDQLRDRYGGIAVEMEAAGMMTRLPVAVIRGISDFADSSKNDAWQPYAAITAAAYAKEVLLCLPPEVQRPTSSGLLNHADTRRDDQQQPRPISLFANQNTRLAQVLPERWAFVGRTEEMAFLSTELGFQAHAPIQKCAVGLWGLTGTGKSQLAARFVGEQRSKHPEREIFWLNAESQESFEQSVASMLRDRDDSVTSAHVKLAASPAEERRRLVHLFFAELNQLEDSRWLLVIDGVTESSHGEFDIHGLVRSLHCGYVLLTSRRRDAVARYYPCQQLKGLSTEDSVSLLQSQTNHQLIEQGTLLPDSAYYGFLAHISKPGIEDLAILLKGLPLALRLAASVIYHYRCSAREYLEIWNKRSKTPNVPGTDEVLSRSLELSLDELERVEPTATKVLTLLSFLYHRDFWFELCYNGMEDIYPPWLQDLAKARTPFANFYPLLADLSFIELRNSSTPERQMWEMHPAVQMAAIQRAGSTEQEYIRCAISLVASQVPRSFETNSWETTRRLWPHVELCWDYIKQGRWGPNIDYTDLESLARVFRHVGRYNEASLIYQRIDHGLTRRSLTPELTEFLAEVLTNLGLVYTRQRRFDQALDCFDRSALMMSGVDTLTLDASFSLMYNKAVVFMMTGQLDEAEVLLRNAAAHFAQQTTELHSLAHGERQDLHLRILNDLGEVFMQKDSMRAALDLFYGVYEAQRGQGEFHPTTVSSKLNIGRALAKLGEFAEARVLLLGVIEVYTQWWGRQHPETMRAIDELAWTLMKEGEGKKMMGESGEFEIRKAAELWNEVLTYHWSVDGDALEVVVRIEENLHFMYSLSQTLT